MGLLLSLAITCWPTGDWLAANFQTLLPQSSASKWVEQANRESASAYERQVVWLVEGGDSASVQSFLSRVNEQLIATGYADPNHESEQARRWQALSAALYPYRFSLLAAGDRRTLQADPDHYFQEFQRLLYSPLGGQALSTLESDPTGLFGKYIRSIAPSVGQSMGSQREDDGYFRFSVVGINAQQLGFDALGGLYDLYQSLSAEARAQGLKLYATGAPLYSAYGVHSAKLEMSTIGIASLLVLIALLLWALRSAPAVGLTLACVLSGVAGGLVVTVLVLQQIHILTLVFGATLIGIAADYALHYFSHALLPQWTPATALNKVFRGLLLGMLSSVVAFLALVILPFPGVRQIGLFMASGLLCSFLTVCLLFPAIFRGVRTRRPLPGFCLRPQWVWRGSVVVIPVVLIMMFGALFWLPAKDDVREFYAAPKDLNLAEQAITRRLQTSTDSRYLLLRSRSKSELWALEEAVISELESLQDEGALEHFFGITQLVPSQTTQAVNYALFRELAQQGFVRRHMQAMGFSADPIATLQETITQEFDPVTVEELSTLALPLGIGGFLGCDEGECASWIRLSGIHAIDDVLVLEKRRAGLELVDPVENINSQIATYRTAVGLMLIVAIALTQGFLSIVCGWRRAMRIVCVPVATCIISLLGVGLLHWGYSIINLMALLLVLGVSLDYAIFRAFTQPQEQSATTLAITLSALTSVLAFGMLAFSSTPVISSFGQTIALGLCVAYTLSWVRFDKGDAS